jgi:hypothetical protein
MVSGNTFYTLRGRQSLRGAPVARVSTAAADEPADQRSLREGDTRPRLPSLLASGRERLAVPHQSLRLPARTVQLLRLLQRLRLHQLFEGLAADDDPALALPNAEFALRTNADVLKVNTDGSGKEAIGVTYVDAQGGEVEQPAAMVILAGFPLHNPSWNAKTTFGA